MSGSVLDLACSEQVLAVGCFNNWIICCSEPLLDSRGSPYSTDLVSSVYMPHTASCHSEVSIPSHLEVRGSVPAPKPSVLTDLRGLPLHLQKTAG